MTSPHRVKKEKTRARELKKECDEKGLQFRSGILACGNKADGSKLTKTIKKLELKPPCTEKCRLK